ncbi:hypothetical protein PCANC_20644 [Puccinia coronata f. sp. avenae]|uniref:Uncharacterized protein n=1 Tax=Puccinia coronata f. sp. avenae TaxID=200324 RepID=A0A2N5SDF9_9BASI|nr:hypothetical protein PCANC_20644 [Puccinia coronata f. sp. avenae]
MFYLAHKTNRNVVEDVVWPTPHQPLDLLQVFVNSPSSATNSDGGLDVEILRPESPCHMYQTQPPARISPFSKGPLALSRRKTPDWQEAHPSLAAPSNELVPAAHLVPAITIQEASLEPLSETDNSSEAESEDDGGPEATEGDVSESKQVKRMFRSAMVALKRALGGLTKANDRNKMVMRMSACLMERFKEVGFSAGRQVELKCPGLHKSTLVDFSCTTNTRDLARAELESLVKDFQSVGWAGLKRAHKLLATERFKKAFLATLTVTCMIVFRETCFEAVTILKDGGILKAQRQIQ